MMFASTASYLSLKQNVPLDGIAFVLPLLDIESLPQTCPKDRHYRILRGRGFVLFDPGLFRDALDKRRHRGLSIRGLRSEAVFDRSGGPFAGSVASVSLLVEEYRLEFARDLVSEGTFRCEQ